MDGRLRSVMGGGGYLPPAMKKQKGGGRGGARSVTGGGVPAAPTGSITDRKVSLHHAGITGPAGYGLMIKMPR